MLHPRLLGRILSSAVALLLLATPAAAQNGRIFGVVTDEDGEPLKGASVTAHSPAGGQTLTATTDAKGRFAMIALRGGTWEFVATAPGYTEESGSMLVRMGSPNRTMTFILRRKGAAFVGALGGIDAKDLQRDLEKADQLFAAERYDEAITAYKSLLERAPVLTSIQLQVAAAYRRLNKPDEAIAVYRRLLDADPEHSRATLEMAGALQERGDAAGAEALLVQTVDRGAGTRDVFYMLGETRLQAGDASAAMSWFEKAASADPNWAKPLLRLGEQALARGERDAAARWLHHAQEVDPDAPEARTAHSLLETVNR